jgi:5-carboxyvanillate decarboxylase
MTDQTRRNFLHQSALFSTAAAISPMSIAQTASGADFFRISTEETFGVPEVYDATAALIRGNPTDEAGLTLPPKDAGITKKLFDLGEGRIADMDQGRIDKQLLSLWSPGVQVFPPRQATELAAHVNDTLAAAVRNHPDRFAGLVTVAPQDPAAAAREIERGMTGLGLHGVLINSYTKGEFLDNRLDPADTTIRRAG